MESFVVYKNKSASQGMYPYLMDVQAPVLGDLGTRTVIPLYAYDDKIQIKILNPLVMVDSKKYLLLTQQIASIPKGCLGDRVSNVIMDRGEVLASIDFLVTGF